MGFKRTIEKMAFKKLSGLALVFSMLLMIPITVWLSQQQTKIAGKAYFEKPTPLTPTQIEYGNPSTGKPQITLVWPFLGKAGDTVLIYGENFGNNPRDKSLTLGSYTVSEKDIVSWTPKLIEFTIPDGAEEGTSELISLTVAGQEAEWEHPFTIYSKNTKVQISKPNNHLQIINPPDLGKIIVDYQDGNKTEARLNENISLPEGKTIISIKLIDQNSTLIPFFVDPSEFGF